MKKIEKSKKEQKLQSRLPKRSKGVIKLNEHDLEQVQGGIQNPGVKTLPWK